MNNNNLNQKANTNETMTKVKSLNQKLNDLRKEIYCLYPNFSISDISKIISCINLTETSINKANVNQAEKERFNNPCRSKVNVVRINNKDDLDEFITSVMNNKFDPNKYTGSDPF